MANRTVKDAKSIRGTNPQYLIEKIIRTRIYDCQFWKEECFALSAELLVDKAMEIRYLGGVYGGNIKPTPFICLTLKMLQIQPEKDIIVEFIKNEEFKYVRALGAYYMRLTGTSLDCYKYLEPLYNDSRKLRRKNRQGAFELVHLDEFIDELLREDRVCDIILPRIQKRHVLEENNELETKVSCLEEDPDEGIESSADEEEPEKKPSEPPPELEKPAKSSREEKRRSPPPTSRRRSGSRERDRRDRDRRRGSRERVRERDTTHRSRDTREERDAKRQRRSHSRERRHRSKSPAGRGGGPGGGSAGNGGGNNGPRDRERGGNSYRTNERSSRDFNQERERRRERDRQRY